MNLARIEQIYIFAKECANIFENYMAFKSYFTQKILITIIVIIIPIHFYGITNSETTDFEILSIKNNFNSDILQSTSDSLINPSKETKSNKRLKINRPEFFWAISHPFVANKALKITKKALNITDSIEDAKILTDPKGGRLDAFRHGIWMAMLSQEIGAKKALKLGIAHEKANYLNFKRFRPYSSYKNNKMDSINNIKGVMIGLSVNNNNELCQVIIDSINAGGFVIIFKTDKGEIMDCLGNTIRTNDWVWDRKECLIYSGFEIVIWEP